MSNNTNRKRQYKQYLNSDEWKELRNLALYRTKGFCQFCGDIATQVHHCKYPKQFGNEHPNSLIPVCNTCHKLSHGIQKMNALTNAQIMSDFSPNGTKIKYLISDGRMYASVASWLNALEVANCLKPWFESGLERTAILKGDSAGGSLVMQYRETPVYRWHAVAEQLRAFDRAWHSNTYKNRTQLEQSQIKRFHENYEKIVSWGYDLQERAINSLLQPLTSSSTQLTQDNLLDALKHAVGPRLRQHDTKLDEHDIIISEIKESVPTLRDPEEFITVKQAIREQGFDENLIPNHVNSRENFSGLAGQLLVKSSAIKGHSVLSRIDGQSVSKEMNTYKRSDIYKTLNDISSNEQYSLTLD